jgi:hypothetical protein
MHPFAPVFASSPGKPTKCSEIDHFSVKWLWAFLNLGRKARQSREARNKTIQPMA